MNYSIIITASFIPSHPSIKIIRQTIESLQLINVSDNIPIIIAHDYSDNSQYKKYFDNLSEYIKDKPNINVVKKSSHGHLTGNIRNAMNFVTTEYVLIIQHDLKFIEKFDIENIIYDMYLNRNLKHVRFNLMKTTSNGPMTMDNALHRDRWGKKLFGLQLKCKNYSYTRTPGWSDNNHICLTSYYKDLILTECNDGSAMEHNYKKKIRTEEIHNKYGTYIFGPLNQGPVIEHTDGRFTI